MIYYFDYTVQRYKYETRRTVSYKTNRSILRTTSNHIFIENDTLYYIWEGGDGAYANWVEL